jgi:hypothetical protein
MSMLAVTNLRSDLAALANWLNSCENSKKNLTNLMCLSRLGQRLREKILLLRKRWGITSKRHCETVSRCKFITNSVGKEQQQCQSNIRHNVRSACATTFLYINRVITRTKTRSRTRVRQDLPIRATLELHTVQPQWPDILKVNTPSNPVNYALSTLFTHLSTLFSACYRKQSYQVRRTYLELRYKPTANAFISMILRTRSYMGWSR